MFKNRLFFLIVAAIFLLLSSNAEALSQYEKEASVVLNRANDFFLLMKNKNYKKVWFFLTVKSKETIIEDVCAATEKTAESCSIDKIKRDFEDGAGAAKTYWNTYLHYFNPDMVLNESLWNIKYIHTGKAEISIKYKKTANPTFLIMKKENGLWKVGLAETFFPK